MPIPTATGPASRARDGAATRPVEALLAAASAEAEWSDRRERRVLLDFVAAEAKDDPDVLARLRAHLDDRVAATWMDHTLEE